jgi:hypothetical protein
MSTSVPTPGAEAVADGLTGSQLGATDSGSGHDGSGELGAKFDCPACMPEDLPYCDHRPDALPLATALAQHFQATDEPTREQMGWFLDDAGSLLKDAGTGSYTIRKLGEGWHSEHAFLLNNLVVTIGEGGKDCPAQPEVAAVLPEGHVLLRVSEDDGTCREVGRVIQQALTWVSDRDYDKASDAWADVARAVVRALREDT